METYTYTGWKNTYVATYALLWVFGGILVAVGYGTDDLHADVYLWTALGFIAFGSLFVIQPIFQIAEGYRIVFSAEGIEIRENRKKEPIHIGISDITRLDATTRGFIRVSYRSERKENTIVLYVLIASKGVKILEKISPAINGLPKEPITPRADEVKSPSLVLVIPKVIVLMMGCLIVFFLAIAAIFLGAAKMGELSWPIAGCLAGVFAAFAIASFILCYALSRARLEIKDGRIKGRCAFGRPMDIAISDVAYIYVDSVLRSQYFPEWFPTSVTYPFSGFDEGIYLFDKDHKRIGRLFNPGKKQWGDLKTLASAMLSSGARFIERDEYAKINKRK